MKRIIILLLTILMIACCSGCTKEDPKPIEVTPIKLEDLTSKDLDEEVKNYKGNYSIANYTVQDDKCVATVNYAGENDNQSYEAEYLVKSTFKDGAWVVDSVELVSSKKTDKTPEPDPVVITPITLEDLTVTDLDDEIKNYTGSYTIVSNNTQDDKNEATIKYAGENDKQSYEAVYLVKSTFKDGAWVIDSVDLVSSSKIDKTPAVIPAITLNDLTSKDLDEEVKNYKGNYTIVSNNTQNDKSETTIKYTGENDTQNYEAEYLVKSTYKDGAWVIDSVQKSSSKKTDKVFPEITLKELTSKDLDEEVKNYKGNYTIVSNKAQGNKSETTVKYTGENDTQNYEAEYLVKSTYKDGSWVIDSVQKSSSKKTDKVFPEITLKELTSKDLDEEVKNYKGSYTIVNNKAQGNKSETTVAYSGENEKLAYEAEYLVKSTYKNGAWVVDSVQILSQKTTDRAPDVLPVTNEELVEQYYLSKYNAVTVKECKEENGVITAKVVCEKTYTFIADTFDYTSTFKKKGDSLELVSEKQTGTDIICNLEGEYYQVNYTGKLSSSKTPYIVFTRDWKWKMYVIAPDGVLGNDWLIGEGTYAISYSTVTMKPRKGWKYNGQSIGGGSEVEIVPNENYDFANFKITVVSVDEVVIGEKIGTSASGSHFKRK